MAPPAPDVAVRGYGRLEAAEWCCCACWASCGMRSTGPGIAIGPKRCRRSTRLERKLIMLGTSAPSGSRSWRSSLGIDGAVEEASGRCA